MDTPSVPKAPDFSLADLFKEAESLVNPPDAEVEAALAVEEQGATTQLQLPGAPPAFALPFEGMQITSETTGNTYTFGPLIGEGEFGYVFHATDLWLNELAIKVLKPRGTYEQIRTAATQEFNKLVTLRHVNVTHVVEAFEFNTTFYIVTERCHGPVSRLLNPDVFDGKLWLLPIARCLLQAVHFLHLNGYAHQDIHAGNVFMQMHRDEFGATEGQSASFTFKLADLGIAKLFSEIDAQNTMLNGSIAPPEFLNHAFGPLDHRVDIYHSALLLLQLQLTKPLVLSNADILEGVPRQIADLLPAPVGPALSRALRRHVADRTPTALALWSDLQTPAQEHGQLQQFQEALESAAKPVATAAGS
jgi:serine/threonine-protein kinase